MLNNQLVSIDIRALDMLTKIWSWKG